MLINIAKLDSQVEVNFESLPETSKAYIVAYGLRQCLNDSIAAKDLVGKAASDKIESRLAALADGSIGVRAAAQPRDPLAAMALSIAKKLLAKKVTRKGNEEAFDAKALELAALPQVIAAAQKALDATSGLEIEI